MNRPSRTDDDLGHSDWNQNPPFLAPDLTTRQDLNGISNARVQRSRRGAFGLLDEKYLAGPGAGCDLEVDGPPPRRLAMAGTNILPFIAPWKELGGEGQARSSSQIPWAWIWWFVSVLATSTLMHLARDLFTSYPFAVSMSSNQGSTQDEYPVDIVHHSHLTKRQDRCVGQGVSAGDYNVPLHVGALLIILVVSGLACGFPLLAKRFPILRIPKFFFFGVRHFGTGVLLATAFVHLLPTAFISLGNPCLSNFWTTDYPAMPGAIALVGIFFVTIIEMVFSPMRQMDPQEAETVEVHASDNKVVRRVPTGPSHGHCGHPDVALAVTRSSTDQHGGIAPAPPHGHHHEVSSGTERAGVMEAQDRNLTPEQLHKKSILQCMLLEVGILFHSVFIGMALSVSVGTDFVVLLVAIAFHQMFEGLALGARISAINWPDKSPQPWLMVLAYGCTTPIGQAIGLATHTLYSPDSEFGLVLVGTMNALSSGLLVFAALIELLAEDFLSDHSWYILRGKKRVVACILVFAGAAGMSLVGAWA